MKLAVFKDKVKDFLTFLEVEKNVSINTLRAYDTDLKQVLIFWDKIQQNEKNIVLSFNEVIRRYVLALFYKKISKATLARKISCLKSFATFLRSLGIKLVLTCKAPRVDRKLPAILTVDEIFYLLDSVKNEDMPSKFPCRDKTVFELIYATGVRCSELVNIKLSDIDFENKSIRVLGKGRQERIVLFGNKAKDRLLEYLEKERPFLHKINEIEYIFLNVSGGKLTQRSVQRIFAMFRNFLKIERKLTPHKIRHSFATHLLNQGVDLRIIQELLGHKTIATTEIYTHVSSAQLAKMCDEKHPLNSLDHLVLGKLNEK